MHEQARRILVVDDNRAIHDDFRKILAADNAGEDELAALEADLFGECEPTARGIAFEIESAFQGEEAIDKVNRAIAEARPYAMVFCDVRMPPGMNGIDASAEMLKLDPNLQVVICSAYSDHEWEDILEVLDDSAARVLILRKPFESIEVRQLAFSLTEKSDLSARAARRMDELDSAVTARTQELTAAMAALSRQMADKERMEGELRLAQKLEAVGQLAAGVAHEINTPIQYVSDNLTFLRTSFEALMSVMQVWAPVVESAQARGEPAGVAALKKAREVDIDFLAEQLPEALTESVAGVTRVGNIVKAMKEFAYPDQDDACEADINQALKNTIVVSQNEHKLVATVETDFEEDLPHVLCFPGEVNQVFLNLLVNGAHAISAADRDGQLGVLRITTRHEGDDVVVSISDTGTGIPDAIRDRIFEPFFTTKEVGKGTGQGLAIAHRIIVDKHGGSLRVDSEVGRGSTFHIRLPIAGRNVRAA